MIITLDDFETVVVCLRESFVEKVESRQEFIPEIEFWLCSKKETQR